MSNTLTFIVGLKNIRKSCSNNVIIKFCTDKVAANTFFSLLFLCSVNMRRQALSMCFNILISIIKSGHLEQWVSTGRDKIWYWQANRECMALTIWFIVVHALCCNTNTFLIDCASLKFVITLLSLFQLQTLAFKLAIIGLQFP